MNKKPLRLSLAKETRERREGMRERKEGIPAVSCGRGNSGREEGGEGRNGVWGRHTLKIGRAAGEGKEAGRGKEARSKEDRACVRRGEAPLIHDKCTN